MMVKQDDLYKVISAVSEDVLLELSSFIHTAEWRTLASDAKDVPIIGVMGEFSAGKSTFINALLGTEILKTDILPTTAVVTFIKYGEQEKVVAYDNEGKAAEYPLSILDVLTAEGDEGNDLRSTFDYIELQLPNERLQTMTLVDTPGFNAGNELHTARSKRVLERLDDAMWLFMFGLVGKETERQSIQSLCEQTSIMPLGIINGIDKAEEYSSEPLDPVKYARAEERKLSEYVRGMIGVSSLDALQAADSEDSAHWWELSRFGLLLERLAEDHRESRASVLTKRLERMAELTNQLKVQLEQQMEAYGIRSCILRLTVDGEKQLSGLDQSQTLLIEKLIEINDSASQLDEFLTRPKDSFVKQWMQWMTAKESYNAALNRLAAGSGEVTRQRQKLAANEKALLEKRRQALAKHREVMGYGAGRVKALFARKRAVKSVRLLWESVETHYGKYLSSRADLSTALEVLAMDFEEQASKLDSMLEQKYEQLLNGAIAATFEYRKKVEKTDKAVAGDLRLLDRFLPIRRFQLTLGEHLSELKEAETHTAGAAAAYEALLELRQMDVYADLAERIRGRLKKKDPDAFDPNTVQRAVPAEWKAIARDALQRDRDMPEEIDIQIRRPIYWFGKLRLVLLLSAAVFLFVTFTNDREQAQLKFDHAVSQVSEWFESVFVESSMDEPASENDGQQQADDGVIGYAVVKAAELNVRTTYSTQGEVVRTLQQEERVDIIGEMNGWLQIGKNEWISGSDKYVQYTQLEE